MNAAQSARSIKKRRAPEKAADCLQYERMDESGICEVEPGLFSMTMAFTDVNFQLARQEEQKSLFTQYSEFLNYFDPDTHLQISLVTRRVDEAEFRRDTFLPMRGDVRDQYSEEMNRVISEKALQGQNGLIREKYITISLHEDDYRKAQVRLLKRAEDIQNLFKRMGSTVRRLSGIERLNLLHGITRPEEVMAFSYDWLLAEDSITTKDFIAPSGYNWKPEHDDSRAVYLRFWLSSCRTSLAVSALRIMQCCPIPFREYYLCERNFVSISCIPGKAADAFKFFSDYRYLFVKFYFFTCFSKNFAVCLVLFYPKSGRKKHLKEDPL